MMIPKILIVDDEENILFAIKRIFRREKYEILTATSAEEGLKIIEQQDVDLVISDLKMPVINGVEFLAMVKENKPDALRIMLTGHADLKSVIEAIEKGEVYRFLLKPWDDEELKVTIKRALEFHHLQKENLTLTHTIKKQNAIISELEKQYPGINSVKRDRDGSVILDIEEATLETEKK
jgi:two-component system probable response regulator PhcQ